MSLLSRKVAHISLSPVRVALTLVRGGWRPRRVQEAATVEYDRSQPEWAGTLDALRSLLGRVPAAGANASVVLANHFVRYLTLPAAAGIAAKEEHEYARARFAHVHGDAARNWSARAAPSPGGGGWIAAATEAALLAALQQECASCGLRLVSCQPALMAQFNACRSGMGSDAWLASIDRTRILVARIEHGRWHSVRNMPHDGSAVALEEIIARESLLSCASGDSSTIFTTIMDGIRVDAGNLRLETVRHDAAATDPVHVAPPLEAAA